jgi:CBS domain-containing protein
MPLQIMFSLCFLKFTSWVISLGSGTSGGTLAPLLTIGGALGGLLGVATLQVAPASEINIATCVLIGMAAMFAGASRALLTSIIFALETTMQPHGLLPLLGACTASYFISFFLMKGSIMTEKIERRGVYAPISYEPDILQKITVKEIFVEEVNVLSADNTVKEAREWIKENSAEGGQLTEFIVVDQKGNLAGNVKRSQIFDKQNDLVQLVQLLPAHTPYIYEENRLSLAVDIMGKHGFDTLAVVSHGKNKKVEGVLSHKEILNAYYNRRNADETYKQSISLKRHGIKIILKGKQLLNRS